MSKQLALTALEVDIERFSINPDDPTIDAIKNRIADIKSSIHHEDIAKLIESLTKNYGEGKNFFHYLFNSTVALDKKHQVMDECRNISINEIYLAKLADKYDETVNFPLDYAISKAEDRVKVIEICGAANIYYADHHTPQFSLLTRNKTHSILKIL